MKLNSLKYRQALADLGPVSPTFCDPPAEFRNWLDAKGLPTALKDFLIANAVSAGLPFPGGSGGVWTPADIVILNDQESAMLADGLLAVANAINGDFIVVDLAEGVDQVGFVSHDELWERSPPPVRSIFAPVDASIHELLAGISHELRAWQGGPGEKRGYPIDYCSAIQRRRDG
jgi:hypothetical protein